MEARATPVAGAYVIELVRIEDDRGFFARSWCHREFEALGLNPQLTQCNISFNRRRGTLRGMHYQQAPHAEAKLVRCTAGAIFDVVVDLRPESATYRRWFGVELNAENRRGLYVPEGCAHGFQTLSDDAEVFYQMTADYHPESAVGCRWDDPQLQITWPLPVTEMSPRDQAWPWLTPVPTTTSWTASPSTANTNQGVGSC